MNQLQINSAVVQEKVKYSTIESRVKAFCSDHPDGQILTEIVKSNEETGEVIFKAHAIVDGVIRSTSHAMEVRGSNNINQTSHVECAETNAIGRALGMMGYIPKSQLESHEEIENAQLQREEIEKHERMLEVNIERLTIKYKKAIDDKNEEGIEKCRTEMYSNKTLNKAVNASLSNEQVNYLIARQEKITDERRTKQELRDTSIKEFAKEYRKKNLNG
jgi:hypothetical protein